MFRPLELIYFIVVLQFGWDVIHSQHDGVPVRNAPVRTAPVRNAPVYPDGYPDSSASSRISNGRISAHLEYVDRSSTGGAAGTETQTRRGVRYPIETSPTRGDITRREQGSTRRGVEYNPRPYNPSHSSSSSTGGGGGNEGEGEQPTRRGEVARYPTGYDSGSRTHDRPTSQGRDSNERLRSVTSGSDSGGGSTSSSESVTRHRTYDRTSGTDPSRRVYDPTRGYQPTQRRYESPSIAATDRYRVESGSRTIPFDRAPRVNNPVLSTGRTYARQPYVGARQRGGQLERQSHVQGCPADNFRILIDGVECHVAIGSVGTHVCYDDRVLRDRRCCERCLQIKNNQKLGCEYGDHSAICSVLTPGQCYIRNNRNICCQTCERLRNPSQPGCEYGDLSQTCAQLPRRLCAIQENQRICCQTCERMRDLQRPECPFGDRASQCAVISGGACYNARVKEACCSTCQRNDIGVPGCQYGDHNAVWSSAIGDLDCENYTRVYGQTACRDPNFASRCCQSCSAHNPRN